MRKAVLLLTAAASGTIGFSNSAASSTFDDPLRDLQWSILKETNEKLPEEVAQKISDAHKFPCRNVEVAGPAAGHFHDLYGLERASRMRNAAMATSVAKAVNRGISCRPAHPFGFFCSGVAYLNPVRGTVNRPLIDNFQRYGERYAGYVQVFLPMTFRTGQREFVSVILNRRNVRCVR